MFNTLLSVQERYIRYNNSESGRYVALRDPKLASLANICDVNIQSVYGSFR